MHLVTLCNVLGVSPNAFFTLDHESGITVPVHRAKANAKVTPERQSYALQLAKEYSLFFWNIKDPRIVPVIRVKDTSDESANNIAKRLRRLAESSRSEPINLEETFRLMEKLGIHVIIKNFPSTIKAYAFYTNIHSFRVVFVDYNTNIMDLIFALLHESIHAIRDEGTIGSLYDKEEEDFCDQVANYIQFPTDYIEFVLSSVEGLPKSHQVNLLKKFGENNTHALFGLSKQISKIDPSFNLNICAADTNFKKQFKSIGDALFSSNDANSYLNTLNFISTVFIDCVLKQYQGFSDRKLAELLGIEHILDAREVRVELDKMD
jgi:hypothetical protein